MEGGVKAGGERSQKIVGRAGQGTADSAAAAVYYDDMYVERRLSEQTAQEIGEGLNLSLSSP